MIKLDNYHTFNEVAKHNSFSKASKSLFMTQSAVSQSIKQLEKDLSTNLFVRTSKGVTLTNEGEILHRYVKEAINLLENGEKALAKINNLQSGELKIATSDTITKHILIKHLEYFNTLYPNIKLTILNSTTDECINFLKNGIVEICFIHLPFIDKTLTVEEIKETKDVFIAGEKYNYLKSKVLSFDDIVNLPIISLDKKSNSRRYIDNFFLKHDKIIKPEIELGSFDLLVEFSKKNIGISCVTLDFCKKYIDNKNLFILNTEFNIPKRSIGIARISGKQLTPSSLKFINIVRSNLTV